MAIDSSQRKAPHNIEAEQALLGAILVDNEVHGRVSNFLEPHHFFDPLHQQIFEVASKLILSGKQATPTILRTFFESAEPIDATLTVPQYLGQLADHVVTTINVRDYGQTIHDLATRRQVILIGEDVVNAAFNSPVDFPPKEQIEEAETRLKALRATANGTTLLTPLSGTMPLPISWLWRMRFAQGKISLLAGQPGRGKSQLTVFFASVVTTGGNWPDGEPCQLGRSSSLPARMTPQIRLFRG